MHVQDFLSPADVSIDLRAAPKSVLLQSLAQAMAKSASVSADTIARSLTDRERLGGTGTGRGVALPHARIPHLLRPAAHFARLAKPIDYEAVDDRPVDLVFVVLLPEAAGSASLQVLACAARKLRDEEVLRRLRQARDIFALYSVLTA